jgi:hypothetical protein
MAVPTIRSCLESVVVDSVKIIVCYSLLFKIFVASVVLNLNSWEEGKLIY